MMQFPPSGDDEGRAVNWYDVELEMFAIAMPKKGRRAAVKLPLTSGVYALLGPNREPWYIGMTCDLARRVKQHWYPHAFVSFFACEEGLAREIERRLIANHSPRFNTQQVRRW
jgi:excinuclease UvrABC nuclease subunit